jgi:hypothetical protein
VILSILVGLLALTMLTTKHVVWDGGYSQAEFQLTFTDAGGKPIEGIELRAEDEAGHNYYYYPVTDYLPGQVPKSNSSGEMVFHHVSNGVEFSGEDRCYLFVFWVTKRRGPMFVCRFLHQGQEVYHFRFGEHGNWERTGGTVHRQWTWSGWPPAEIACQPEESAGQYTDRVRKFFDVNGNGQLDPEEAAAYHACTCYRADEIALSRLVGKPEGEELEFPLVRRNIVVGSSQGK